MRPELGLTYVQKKAGQVILGWSNIACSNQWSPVHLASVMLRIVRKSWHRQRSSKDTSSRNRFNLPDLGSTIVKEDPTDFMYLYSDMVQKQLPLVIIRVGHLHRILHEFFAFFNESDPLEVGCARLFLAGCLVDTFGGKGTCCMRVRSRSAGPLPWVKSLKLKVLIILREIWDQWLAVPVCTKMVHTSINGGVGRFPPQSGCNMKYTATKLPPNHPQCLGYGMLLNFLCQVGLGASSPSPIDCTPCCNHAANVAGLHFCLRSSLQLLLALLAQISALKHGLSEIRTKVRDESLLSWPDVLKIPDHKAIVLLLPSAPYDEALFRLCVLYWMKLNLPQKCSNFRPHPEQGLFHVRIV